MSQRGDGGLLQSAIQRALLILLMFLNATFQRRSHLIERLRELSDFARFIFKAGASAEIAGTKSLHGFEKNLNLSQNETFTAEPRRNQCQQADGESAGLAQVEQR